MKIKGSKNKYILAIETSGIICSVCIYENEKILCEKNIKSGFTHSVVLFDIIEDIFKKNKLTMKNIDIIGVSNGPGSYTGLRIGVACALGLSRPYNTEIRFIDSLKSLAANFISFENKLKNIDYIFAMNDAKANRIYLSIFTSDFKKTICEIIVDVDYFILSFIKYMSKIDLKILFIGDAIYKYKEKLEKSLNKKYLTLNKNLNYPYARSVGLIVINNKKDINNEFINYMQKSQAEREYLKNGSCKNR